MTTSAFDPASRFRFVQFIPHLERSGWDVAHRPNVPDRQWKSPLRGRVVRGVHHRVARAQMKWNRWRDVASSAGYDAVFVNRDLAGRGLFFQKQLLRRTQRVVFDFDDAIFVGPNEAAVAWMCRHAAWVTPGNGYLAEFVTRHTDRCTVIPTVVDTDLYRPSERQPAPLVRVGWSGSDQSVRQTLFPQLQILAALQQKMPFELVVITNTRPPIPEEIRWSFVPWTEASEVEALRSLDVGIMPLVDDAFQRGKCGLKALQYMGVGLPVVASPVGVNAEIVQDGVTGYHALAPSEWHGALERLILSADRRREMGEAGWRRCRAQYSIERWLPVLLQVLETARGSRLAA
jgi:glycosyltransferase involved in cell wall biosynthesis